MLSSRSGTGREGGSKSVKSRSNDDEIGKERGPEKSGKVKAFAGRAVKSKECFVADEGS